MPDVTLTLTQAQIARLDEAWGEQGVPLKDSVLKALARATKQRLREQRIELAANTYQADNEAATVAEDAEFDSW